MLIFTSLLPAKLHVHDMAPALQSLLRTLSQSEQHLATLARCLGSSLGSKTPLAFDEFASGLDRSLAKRVCVGLWSYLSRQEMLPPAT